MNNIVPVVVLTVPFIFVIVIEWLKSVDRRKRYNLQSELYAKALEKGQDIPVDLFVEPKKKGNHLYTGIICIAVGIGLALFFLLMSVSFAQIQGKAATVFRAVAAIGIIPFFVGAAFFIIHFIEKRNNNNENAK
jgi:hypothetical protein